MTFYLSVLPIGTYLTRWSHRAQVHFQFSRGLCVQNVPRTVLVSHNLRRLQEGVRPIFSSSYRLGFNHSKGGVQIETEMLSNPSKPKHLRSNKLGSAWVWGPEYLSNIKTGIPSHIEIESIEPRPTLHSCVPSLAQIPHRDGTRLRPFSYLGLSYLRFRSLDFPQKQIRISI